jgi:RNA polymerase sigma-70 factor, ECF subfamily
MRTTQPDSRSALQQPTATLGDVLYAGKPKRLVPEEEWASLVRRIAASDQVALHAVYQRASRLVFTLAVRLTGSRETAEEVTLDVFHDIWRRASAYDPANGTVLGWIMNQARSRAIDRLRFERRKKRVDSRSDDSPDAIGAPDARDPVEVEQQNGALQRALGILSQREREAVEAAYLSELTHAEAAVHLKQPLGTVKTRIRSGLSKLRQALDDEAGK